MGAYLRGAYSRGANSRIYGIGICIHEAITKFVYLCPSITDLIPPADFRLLHVTMHKLLFSVLLTKEDNGEKAQLSQFIPTIYAPYLYACVRIVSFTQCSYLLLVLPLQIQSRFNIPSGL